MAFASQDCARRVLRNVLFRVTLEPSAVNRLQKISQVMTDKTSLIPPR
jgi:hypothetical protein